MLKALAGSLGVLALSGSMAFAAQTAPTPAAPKPAVQSAPAKSATTQASTKKHRKQHLKHKVTNQKPATPAPAKN